MSTTAATPTQPSRRGKPAETAIPFPRLLGVEFRKAWDTKAGFWLLATIVGLVAVVEVIYLIVAIVNDASDVRFWNFVSYVAYPAGLLLPVLGIMLVTSEWGQRTAMVTFTLEPRRSRVIWAKLLVGLLFTAVTIVVSFLVGLVCNAIFAASGGETRWFDVLLWENMASFAITQTLSMLVGFAFAALVLNTATAIVLFFAYSYVIPIFLFIAENMDWFEKIAGWVNPSKAQGELMTFGEMTGTHWAQLLVTSLIWVGIPLVIGLRRILRAEVK